MCPAAQAFGNTLREWRIGRQLPLKAVASEIGVSVSTVDAWETAVRFPSGVHLDRVSAYMGLPVCALLYHTSGGCPHGGLPKRRASGSCPA